MKLKTEELTGLALDWALAVALGYAQINTHVSSKVFATMPDGGRKQVDHTDPATCMGLIKKYRANINHIDPTNPAPQIEVSIWYALTGDAAPDFDCQWVIGDTVEQAVARCVVQIRLGDEVEVPDELCGVQS